MNELNSQSDETSVAYRITSMRHRGVDGSMQSRMRNRRSHSTLDVIEEGVTMQGRHSPPFSGDHRKGSRGRRSIFQRNFIRRLLNTMSRRLSYLEDLKVANLLVGLGSMLFFFRCLELSLLFLGGQQAQENLVSILPKPTIVSFHYSSPVKLPIYSWRGDPLGTNSSPRVLLPSFPSLQFRRELYRSGPDFGDLLFTNSDDVDPTEEVEEGTMAPYYADDDYVRGQGVKYNEEYEYDSDIECRRTHSHRLTFPSCNELHQLDSTTSMFDGTFRFVGSGAFREVFTYRHDYLSQGADNIAIKQISYEHEANFEMMEYMRMDALVAERLTSKEKIYDIYGHCGLATLSELFYHGDIYDTVIGGNDGYFFVEDLDDEDEVDPQNNLSPNQKLVLALEMAEGLSELHGYEDSLMIHDDVQLVQFLLDKDKTMLKLNDFNRAEFPLWDENRKDYCRYLNGRGKGRWRSPEEYNDLPLTEQIDVFSLGNLYFSLLTGLNPVWIRSRNNNALGTVASFSVPRGQKPVLDERYATRSEAEAAIVEVMYDCLEYEPYDRPTIFEVVDRLKRAMKTQLEDKGISRQSILKSL